VPAYVIVSLHWLWLAWLGHMRPHNAWLITYETLLHRAAMPLWILQGVVHGLAGGWFGLHYDIKVTPKGPGGLRLLSWRNLSPLLVMVALGAGTLLAVAGSTRLPGLMIFTVMMQAAALAIAGLHYAENHRPLWGPGARAPPAAHSATLWGVLALSTAAVVLAGARDAIGLPGVRTI
jgi:cellulose synthase (UDP-forming)